MRGAVPCPIRSARRSFAIEAGADGITAHLREDRRHIRSCVLPSFPLAGNIPDETLSVAPAGALGLKGHEIL
jgi:hypothetical protein